MCNVSVRAHCMSGIATVTKGGRVLRTNNKFIFKYFMHKDMHLFNIFSA